MSEIKLVATGDVLLHSRVYDISKKDGKYDFKDKMAPAKNLLQAGDVSVVNLESIVAGEEFGLSSFPEFNNPIELAENLKEFGTDIVTTANNHTFDYGEEGVLKSIENLEKIGLSYVGSYKSEQDRKTVRVIEKKGIKVAFFAYSAVNMGGKPPSEKRYLLNRIRRESQKTIRKEIETFKRVEKPDLIVVGAHFGREYGLLPIDEQRDLTNILSDIGADVIIGHHPHVLQPAQWITNSRGKKSFAIYSLGNFYSGQKGLYRQIGGALNLTIKKDSKGKVTISNPVLDLTFVDASKEKNYQMHLLRDYIATNPYIKTVHDSFDSLDIYSELTNRLSQWMPELKVR